MQITQDNMLSVLQGMITAMTADQSTSTADDGFSDKTTAENYRWKDVGHVAGSKKELAAMFAKAKKGGQNLTINDIDWDTFKDDPRFAQTLITKKNVFGVVDWEALKKDGMPPEVAYFIHKAYRAISDRPIEPRIMQCQKEYVQAISNFREMMEQCRTHEDVLKAINSISRGFTHPGSVRIFYSWELGELSENYVRANRVALEKFKGDIAADYDKRIMSQLGEKFLNWLKKKANKDYREMVRGQFVSKGRWEHSPGTSWDWALGEPKVTTDTGKPKAPKKKSFQLESASHLERIGGREVKIQSSEDLAGLFGLRAVQSGNYVLKDKSSAEYHMKAAAESMFDMSDILGIDPKHLSLNGNLALAFGARGKSGALAHYEPAQRVINITKMRGGGTLSHEYFHALDNLIQDLDTQTTGDIGFYGTKNPQSMKNPRLAAAFQQLNQAMTRIDRPVVFRLKVADINIWNSIIQHDNGTDQLIETLYKNLKNSTVGRTRYDALIPVFNAKTRDEFNQAVDGATKAISRSHNGNNLTISNQMVDEMGPFIAIKAMYLQTKGESVGATVNIEPSPPTADNPDGLDLVYFVLKTSFIAVGQQTDYHVNAKAMDEGKSKDYWQSPHEMAARAFTSYMIDKLAEQGRKNDYLAYEGSHSKMTFPQGEERKQIAAAFDNLFEVIRSEGTLQKAAANQKLMDSLFTGTRPI